GLVGDQRRDVIAGELVASFERGELDQECEADDLALELLHELDGAGHSATRREEVVDDQHPRARLDRILVHLEGRRTVLEVVLNADHVPRQLAELAHRDETDAELVGDGRGEDEPAGLHAHNDVDLFPADLREEAVDRGRERVAILEERSDVFEEDPRLRKVGDVAYLAGEAVSLYRHDTESSRGARTSALTVAEHLSRRASWAALVLALIVLLAGCNGQVPSPFGSASLPQEFPSDFPTPPSSKLTSATGPLPFVPAEMR